MLILFRFILFSALSIARCATPILICRITFLIAHLNLFLALLSGELTCEAFFEAVFEGTFGILAGFYKIIRKLAMLNELNIL